MIALGKLIGKLLGSEPVAPPASTGPELVVVGSCNMDQIAYIPRFPGAGETIHGSKYLQGFGGKGANQCVMAGKLGVKAAMVGKVGNDSIGAETFKNFASLNINTDHLTTTTEAASGVAPIFVHESSGENLIVVVGGANNLLTVGDVQAASSMIKGAKVVMCQNEIRMDSTLETLRIAAQSAGTTAIFNPAPAPEDGQLPAEIYSLTDIFVVNETEAELMTGVKVSQDDLEWVPTCCNVLLERGVKTALITLGSRGAVAMGAGVEGVQHETVDKVKSVDTAGAGDSFLGALGFYLATSKLSLSQAIKRAGKIAGYSVQKNGTQSSYPLRKELPAELF